jgi:parallel beta-helix repeat protein
MKGYIVPSTALAIIVIGTLYSAFRIELVKTQSPTIIVPDDFPTIQDAINNATDGDTIFVRSGKYVENLIINKTISLVGEDKITTIIDGNHTGNVVRITRDNVNIENFTVENSGSENITDFNCGILVRTGSNCTITDNVLQSNYCGIRIFLGSYNTSMLRNTMTGNFWGVIHSSSASTWRNNNFTDNTYHFYLDVEYSTESINDIDISNTVDGKPIYYWINQHAKTVPSDAGAIILVDSTNMVIKDSVLTRNGIAVYLVNTNDTKVQNVTCENNWRGIDVVGDNNMIVDNNIVGTYYEGVSVSGSTNNTVIGNNIVQGEDGVFVGNAQGNWIEDNSVADTYFGVELGNGALGNTICNNYLADNLYGLLMRDGASNNTINGNIFENNTYASIDFQEASGNLIYHNNFLEGKNQVYDKSWDDPLVLPSLNEWDNSYPRGGTYWGMHVGEDSFSGRFQNETGSDGISDSSYAIYSNNTDEYPLMGPFGSITLVGENSTVFPDDDVGLIFQSVITEGSTTVSKTELGPEPPPPGFALYGEYYDVESTANFSGDTIIRVIYDDSNMTKEGESKLQLVEWDEQSQSWMNMTTHIDTESNVIYGRAPHLSAIGIHILAGCVTGNYRTLMLTIPFGADTFNVSARTNSAISNLAFNEQSRTISFDVEGKAGTEGSCNITIPITLLGGPYTIKIDNITVPANLTALTNATHAFIYFEYNHSSHHVVIVGTTGIPEFPHVLVLPLLMVATLLAAVIYRKKARYSKIDARLT